MQTKFQNRVSMGLAVLDVFTKYPSAWAANTALTADKATLAGLIQTIQDAATIQGTVTSGVANGKNRKQIAMIAAVLPIADDLHALAGDNNDAELAAKTEVNFSKLAGLGDTGVGPRCQEILDLATAHAAALALSDTTAADIAEAQAAVDAYKPTATRNAIVDRSSRTQEIEAGVHELETFLRSRLDKRMSKYAKKAPAFFADYTNARKIIDLGIRHEHDAAPAATAPAATPAAPAVPVS